MKLADAYVSQQVTVKGELKIPYTIEMFNGSLVRIQPANTRANYSRWIHVTMLESVDEY